MRGIDEALIGVQSGTGFSYDVDLKGFPQGIGRQKYAANKDIVWSFGSLFLFFPSMLIFVLTMSDIVREKENGQREQMEFM